MVPDEPVTNGRSRDINRLAIESNLENNPKVLAKVVSIQGKRKGEKSFEIRFDNKEIGYLNVASCPKIWE